MMKSMSSADWQSRQFLSEINDGFFSLSLFIFLFRSAQIAFKRIEYVYKQFKKVN